jgi:hypothetical protein
LNQRRRKATHPAVAPVLALGLERTSSYRADLRQLLGCGLEVGLAVALSAL